MAVKKSKTKKQRSINQGRPPLAKAQPSTLSAKATRTVIRSHHNLQKAYTQALKDGDESRAHELKAEMAARGGLTKYQLASTQGQSAERGGDSSRVLVDWLTPVLEEAEAESMRLKILEIGALSTKNACSRVPCLDVKRIDLKSQESGIEEIDFMDLPIPCDDAKFDIISLSLVLNYVPDPASRGAMLARIPQFLQSINSRNMIPSLFLVLPLACVGNSRYFTRERLSHIMHALGFQLSKEKTSSKLYYSLWTFDSMTKTDSYFHFRKEELRSGGSRNNFSISLSGRDLG